MKKGILLLWSVLGIGAFIVSPLFAENPSSSCEAFGIQRFQPPREPPPFSLKDLNGNHVALGDYKGKPVLIFFWGTWCAACKEDIVFLQKLYEKVGGELEILTLVIDGEKEKRVKRVVSRYKLTFPVLLDVKEKIARIYGITMIPTTFLINREGFMEGKIVGQRAWNEPLAFSAIKEVLRLR